MSLKGCGKAVLKSLSSEVLLALLDTLRVLKGIAETYMLLIFSEYLERGVEWILEKTNVFGPYTAVLNRIRSMIYDFSQYIPVESVRGCDELNDIFSKVNEGFRVVSGSLSLLDVDAKRKAVVNVVSNSAYDKVQELLSSIDVLLMEVELELRRRGLI